MYKKIMAPEELFFSRIESVNGESIYVLNFTIFAFIFFPIFTCVDPDQHGSPLKGDPRGIKAEIKPVSKLKT